MITIVVSWIVKKLLDYFYLQFKLNVKLFNNSEVLRNTGARLLTVSLDFLGEDIEFLYKVHPIIRGAIDALLREHELRHKEKGSSYLTNCIICPFIAKRLKQFQKLFPDRTFLPPF